MARSSAQRAGANLRTVAKAAEARERQSVNPFGHTFQREAFDWVPVDAGQLADGIAATLGRGSSITFSATQDGGAVKVSVWVDQQKFAAYAATPELLNELLAALVDPKPAIDAGRGS